MLRRLAPSHVALLLDSWKGGPPPEVLQAFAKAEASYRAGDFAGASGALDLLSIRFAEPRWPTLPLPFRSLRVPIPAPQPPSWDPEHALPTEEKEARRARRVAEEQVALAEACVAWARDHGVPADDLFSDVAVAKAAFASGGASAEFYVPIDGIWSRLRERLPRPKGGATTPAPAPER